MLTCFHFILFIVIEVLFFNSVNKYYQTMDTVKNVTKFDIFRRVWFFCFLDFYLIVSWLQVERVTDPNKIMCGKAKQSKRPNYIIHVNCINVKVSVNVNVSVGFNISEPNIFLCLERKLDFSLIFGWNYFYFLFQILFKMLNVNVKYYFKCLMIMFYILKCWSNFLL
jgi:hypothetical protein